jgi:hypothetical protein
MAPINRTDRGLEFSTGLLKFLVAVAGVVGVIATVAMSYERDHAVIDRRIYADSIRHNGTESESPAHAVHLREPAVAALLR